MPQTPIMTITLDLNYINQILASLDKEPHAEVRFLIDEILKQVSAQDLSKINATLDQEQSEERE